MRRPRIDDTLLVQVREGDSFKKLKITAKIEIPSRTGLRDHFTPIILVVVVQSMTSQMTVSMIFFLTKKIHYIGSFFFYVEF